MDLERVHKTVGIFARVAVVDRWVVGSEEFSQHNRQSSLVKTRWTDRESNRLGRDRRHGRRNSIVLEMYMIAVFSVYHRTLDAMDNSEYVAKGDAEDVVKDVVGDGTKDVDGDGAEDVDGDSAEDVDEVVDGGEDVDGDIAEDVIEEENSNKTIM